MIDRRNSLRSRVSLIAVLFTVYGCAQTPPPAESTDGPVFLTEISTEWGLDASDTAWPDGTYYLPELMGPGVGLLDHDGDGDLDVLQVRMPPPGHPNAAAANRLYSRQANGRFTDETARSGLGDPGWGQGVAVGDIDNDGHPDVYVANYGADGLYRNNGDGTFVDITRSAGIVGDHWSSGAVFCDYNRDGHLDLYVVHYLKVTHGEPCRTDAGTGDYCSPRVFDGVPDTLYRNTGDGTFMEVTSEAGVRAPSRGKRAKGLGAVCLDLTDDGWMDIYVANDGESNHLWVNQRDGTFAEQALARGVAVNRHGTPEASMGIGVGDVDRDGRMDILLTHLTNENSAVYVGRAGGMYLERAVESGLAMHDLPYTGFGCGLFDLDHDGDLDFAIANGEILADRSSDGNAGFWDRYGQNNLLFLNDGNGRFDSATSAAGRFAARREVGRGLAVGDLDNDGDLDLVLSNVDGSLRAYRNDAPAADSHWLRIRALAGPRDALGAVVRVFLAEGREAVAPVLAASSFQSSSDPRAHFGLGTTAQVARVEIDWPDGTREAFPATEADRELTLRKGTGTRL